MWIFWYWYGHTVIGKGLGICIGIDNDAKCGKRIMTISTKLNPISGPIPKRLNIGATIQDKEM